MELTGTVHFRLHACLVDAYIHTADLIIVISHFCNNNLDHYIFISDQDELNIVLHVFDIYDKCDQYNYIVCAVDI